MSKRRRETVPAAVISVGKREHKYTTKDHVYVDLETTCDVCSDEVYGFIHCNNYSRWYKKVNPRTGKPEHEGPQNTHTCLECAARCEECGKFMCSDAICIIKCSDCGVKLCQKCEYKCPSCKKIYCQDCTAGDTCKIVKCCACDKQPSKSIASYLWGHLDQAQVETCRTCRKPVCAGPDQRCSNDCPEGCGIYCQQCGHSCFGC